ncbi:MAG: hypothetical protein HN597_14910 [Desulfobacula sp.]|jgi:hypothetical protein|uniref:Uncharacterized protein n=1 Tax=uncultured marine virus TaxID=186617 RepID=A0A0F7L4X0_9VIRU|nr:hypothetical protein [uncultured marine virus]MBT7630973.1 hypothetical protein [Desulfobacula sp.]
MKTINNIILGCLWVLGLLLAGGVVDSKMPFVYQVFVCIFGVVIFSISSFGIIINNKG